MFQMKNLKSNIFKWHIIIYNNNIISWETQIAKYRDLKNKNKNFSL